jgi:hypothetical protein
VNEQNVQFRESAKTPTGPRNRLWLRGFTRKTVSTKLGARIIASLERRTVHRRGDEISKCYASNRGELPGPQFRGRFMKNSRRWLL